MFNFGIIDIKWIDIALLSMPYNTYNNCFSTKYNNDFEVCLKVNM